MPDLRLFEYGSGHSTLDFAARVGHVTSIEHYHFYRDGNCLGL